MVSGSTSQVGYWEVYDTIRAEKMGWDMGYMGTFQSYEDAMKYIKDYEHLFESTPQVFHRFTDKT